MKEGGEWREGGRLGAGTEGERKNQESEIRWFSMSLEMPKSYWHILILWDLKIYDINFDLKMVNAMNFLVN